MLILLTNLFFHAYFFPGALVRWEDSYSLIFTNLLAFTSCSAVALSVFMMRLSGFPLNTFLTRFHLEVMTDLENTFSFFLSLRFCLSENKCIGDILSIL